MMPNKAIKPTPKQKVKNAKREQTTTLNDKRFWKFECFTIARHRLLLPVDICCNDDCQGCQPGIYNWNLCQHIGMNQFHIGEYDEGKKRGKY